MMILACFGLTCLIILAVCAIIGGVHLFIYCKDQFAKIHQLEEIVTRLVHDKSEAR
jgi:hypothetical protein